MNSSQGLLNCVITAEYRARVHWIHM